MFMHATQEDSILGPMRFVSKADDYQVYEALLLERSRWETTIHQACGSGDGAGFQPEVLDEPKGKSVDTHEGTDAEHNDKEKGDADMTDAAHVQ
nr:hypothetical protein [Tanacetum cinerariifolium]